MRERLTVAPIVVLAHLFFNLTYSSAFTFMPIDCQDALDTYVYGINNDGNIVGLYMDSSNDYHGFLYSGGTCITLDDPDAMYTVPRRISNSSRIVGTLIDIDGDYYGFEYYMGKYTRIDYPRATLELAIFGINNRGTKVGVYEDSNGFHGIACDKKGCLNLDLPNARDTQANDINDYGEIVGYYTDVSGQGHGFVYHNGDYDSFDYRNATRETVPWAINNAGDMVGEHWDANSGSWRGFVCHEGNYFDVDYPGAHDTGATDINDNGTIVGSYFIYEDGRWSQRGFIAEW